jgi:two-component system, LytTR family, response regulator LytT
MYKTKILIVDDEVLIAEYIQETLSSLGFQTIKLAHDKEQTLSKIESFKPELVLLDIRMEEELEGIELAKLLNEEYHIPFLFITAHSDKGTIEKALDTNPLGYITKPVKKMDMFAAINLAIKQIELNAKRTLVFKDGYTNVKLFFDDILYVESARNYIYIFTREKKYAIRNSLEWFIQSVPKEEFAKVHRSFVVNTKKISKRGSKTLFIGSIELPTSRRLQVNLD